MERETTYDFVHAIKVQLSPIEYEVIKHTLLTIPAEHRAAFWHLISSGNSAISAFKYCKVLYEFVRNNFINFEDALKVIRCNDISLEINEYPINVEWYEYN